MHFAGNDEGERESGFLLKWVEMKGAARVEGTKFGAFLHNGYMQIFDPTS